MSKQKDNRYMPDGRYIEETSNSDNYVSLYAKDKIQVEGIHTFGKQLMMITNDLMPHYHLNCFEFHYLVRGRMSFMVNNEFYQLKGGDVFVTFPNEVHQNHTFNIKTMYWFSVEDNGNLLSFGPKWSKWLFEKLHNLDNRIINIGLEAKNDFETVFNNITEKNQDNSFTASITMANILNRIIECDKNSEVHSFSDGMAKTVNYINDHIAERITLEELADMAEMSLPHFKLRFKNEVGFPPAFYIRQKKIDKAKEMLAKGYSINETSNKLNFTSTNYFSVVFHKLTLMTPSEYAKNIKDEKSRKA